MKASLRLVPMTLGTLLLFGCSGQQVPQPSASDRGISPQTTTEPNEDDVVVLDSFFSATGVYGHHGMYVGSARLHERADAGDAANSIRQYLLGNKLFVTKMSESAIEKDDWRLRDTWAAILAYMYGTHVEFRSTENVSVRDEKIELLLSRTQNLPLRLER